MMEENIVEIVKELEESGIAQIYNEEEKASYYIVKKRQEIEIYPWLWMSWGTI